jgi:hypothetical protein
MRYPGFIGVEPHGGYSYYRLVDPSFFCAIMRLTSPVDLIIRIYYSPNSTSHYILDLKLNLTSEIYNKPTIDE